jgi:hypothetical protein
VHITPRPFRRLANRIGHTARFADSYADLAPVVAHDRHHAEVKATSPFNNLCNSRDVYDALIQFLSLLKDLAIP